MRSKLVLFSFILLSISCKSRKHHIEGEALQEGTYRLISVQETPWENEKAYLKFNLKSNKLTGSMGCNLFGVSFKTKNNQIHLENVLATARECGESVKAEQKFLENMNQVAAYKFDGDTLRLFSKSGESLFTAKLLKNQLKSQRFKVTQLGGEDFSDKEISFKIDRDKNNLTGNAGCNSFGTDFTINNDSISLGNTRVTRKYCEGKMETEHRFLRDLNQVATFLIDEDRLELNDKNGENLIIAEQIKE